MSSMKSLDRLQAELSGNVYGDAFHTLYKLSQDVSVEHSELMSQAMKWVHKEKVEPLEAENAKLRELAEKTWKAAEMLCQAWDGPCHADGVPIKPPCPLGERDELCVYGQLQRDLRELGVEVDDGTK